ncbi:MAG: asparagine synthase (glutamine-hydrolyzing) [Pseudorhodoplanes sp.]
MCGIAGVTASSVGPVDTSDLRRMARAIAHRGPDGEGIWVSGNGQCGFAHRRLAIIDTSTSSNQPMLDRSGRYVIVFNGEIYNFLELRAELERLGSRFRTDGDTEVILESWRHWGKAMLPKFNGMWAFALHDQQSGETFLARDRFGIKPLYYTHNAPYFAFASEARALRTLHWLDRDIDKAVVARTLFDPFSIEASERTLFTSVRRLPAGHFGVVNNGKIRVERWWRTLEHLPVPPTTPEERSAKFLELFLHSVRLRMRSDVSIGTCLSGGFDSSAVVCAMSHIAKSDHTHVREARDWRKAFVASFPGKLNDETPQALEVACYADVNARLITVDDTDALRDIDKILEHFEDVYISLPTAIWQTYKALRSDNTVVSLDGHGADELMGGYQQVGGMGFHFRNGLQRFTESSSRRRRVADAAKSVALTAARLNFLRGHKSAAPAVIETPFDADLFGSSLEVRNQRLYKMFHIDLLPMILRNFDRMSMAHGIEVRMPFMDWRLVTYVMSLPGDAKQSDGQTKKVARDAMAGLMPENIRTSRRKVGFNSPMPEWMSGALGRWAIELLHQPNACFDELVDTASLRNRIAELSTLNAWDWRNTGRLWPYVQMRWCLEKLYD